MDWGFGFVLVSENSCQGGREGGKGWVGKKGREGEEGRTGRRTQKSYHNEHRTQHHAQRLNDSEHQHQPRGPGLPTTSTTTITTTSTITVNADDLTPDPERTRHERAELCAEHVDPHCFYPLRTRVLIHILPPRVRARPASESRAGTRQADDIMRVRADQRFHLLIRFRFRATCRAARRGARGRWKA